MKKINVMKIISDYKHSNLPLDMVAKNNKVSTAFVLKTVHYFSVKRIQAIADCKKLVTEIDDV